jgi:carboxymethylenebutenolidase
MQVQVKTGEGVADSHIFYPAGSNPAPAVILYMDGVGIRPQLLALGERLAQNGYVALVPNLFYRAGPAIEIDLSVIFTPGPANDRMMSLVMTLTGAQVMSDTRAFLEFLDRDPKVKPSKVGTMGFCMGGGMALRAAGTYPERVAAAASIHGARLATDQPDSPHLLASKMRARVYVAVAGVDPWLFEGETAVLKKTFEGAGVKYQMDTFPESIHGFGVPGNPIYDPVAAEKVWERLLALFGENLR